jgi:hypothetical protein
VQEKPIWLPGFYLTFFDFLKNSTQRTQKKEFGVFEKELWKLLEKESKSKFNLL